MRWWRLKRMIGSIVTLLALCSLALGQCPFCRAVLFRSKEGQQLISGFDNAVLFLLAFPFLLIAIFAARIVWAQRMAPNNNKLRAPRKPNPI